MSGERRISEKNPRYRLSSELIQEQDVQEVQLNRFCRRCHRKLKNERSMQIGYGPVCVLKEVAQRRATKCGEEEMV
jgi:hypothetical protein